MTPVISVTRYHDFSAGHRVYGHESKCAHLHGHNYRVTFEVMTKSLGGPLDELGRVVDFGVIKTLLCEWLESNWDHKMIIWIEDPLAGKLALLDPDGLALVSFNPTAENMAEYLLKEVGPSVLPNDLILRRVIMEETRKCAAIAEF